VIALLQIYHTAKQYGNQWKNFESMSLSDEAITKLNLVADLLVSMDYSLGLLIIFTNFVH